MVVSQKQKAIIVDIDGTISNDKWRRHLLATGQATWDDLNTMSKYDMPFPWCLAIVDAFQDRGYKILFVTARNEKYKEDTVNWLNANVQAGYELFMRPTADTSEDYIIKRNIYMMHVLPFYDIEFCLEDRPSVVQMWRDMGLSCLHCDGDFT